MGAAHRVLVCGLGASGRAAIRLLRAKGIDVLAADERDTLETRESAGLARSLGCEVSLGPDIPLEGWWDAAIVSPGIPVDGAYLAGVRRRRIPLMSELELGWGHAGLPILAVTGSNGKSSVVKALADGFRAAGRRAVACGNYGVPVCQAAMESPDADWLVIEASSFQLETCTKIHPEVAVLLNVLPNHLDRHGTLEAYARLKARLFARQRKGDVALVPPEWADRVRTWSGGRGTWKTFGADPAADYVYSAGRISEAGGEGIDFAGSYFDNDVLGPNAAALYGAARAAGLPPETIRAALAAYEPLPHRSRIVAERDGVRYVDDSKATNLSAMAASIRMQDRPVWLIAGGRPKETDFAAVLPVLRERVRGVFLIGEAADAMAAAWGAAVPCTGCGTLDRAVAEARRAAQSGGTVLLAPACTSYDQFRSFAERGDAFQKIALEKD
jgi:UDP-N-acetylmuramoylalanine--D-glutamate ligase